MTELLETPAAPPPEPPDAARGGSDHAPTELVGGAFFADLVRAHYAWERALDDGAQPGRLASLAEEYDRALKRFQSAEGEILEAYWCVRRPSAVALTEKRQSRRERLLGEHRIRLHRLSNWLMPRSAQKLVFLLHDCDELAIRSEEILRGTPKRIALRSIYEVESSVLAFLERTSGRPSTAEVDEFVGGSKHAMRTARECYAVAADKVARMVYVGGLFAGVAAMLPVAVLAGLGLWIFGALHLHQHGTQAFFACLTAGAVGAFVSVLSRMSSPAKFELDPEVGRRAIFYLGAYRPLVGSIFGLALYFLLQSSLLQVESGKEFATFVVAAFLGGFSERFVKVMLNSAEQSVGGGGSSATVAVAPPDTAASTERSQ
ncbi:MAG: hypothetical protein QOK22_86 [Gaiellaceae bacterium]|nr:hypothetical protein [Gaiellaceae bacterium]